MSKCHIGAFESLITNILVFKKYFVSCLLIAAFNFMNAQKKEIKNLIAVRYDNDVFAGTDRYYSFGNFLDYRRILDSDFLLKKREGDNLQLNFSLGQLGFTPTFFNLDNVELYDYTNAGWLFLESEISRYNKKDGLSLAVELGVTGEISLAGTVQIEIHDKLNLGGTPLWIDEIPNNFLVNFKAGYIRNLYSLESSFYIDSLTNGVAGLKDLYFDQEFLLSFGKRLDLNKSTLYNNISTESEFYGYIGAAYRYVAYNHLLEGSLFDNEAPFTVEIENNLFRLRMGVGLQIERNGIKLEHNFNSAENVLAEKHSYTTIIYERNF